MEDAGENTHVVRGRPHVLEAPQLLGYGEGHADSHQDHHRGRKDGPPAPLAVEEELVGDEYEHDGEHGGLGQSGQAEQPEPEPEPRGGHAATVLEVDANTYIQ